MFQSSSEMSALRRDSQALYSRLIGPVEHDWTEANAGDRDGRIPGQTAIRSADDGKWPISDHTDGDRSHSRSLRGRADAFGPCDFGRRPALLVAAASSADAGLFVIPNVAAGVEETARRFHSARVLNSPEATFSAVASALPAARFFILRDTLATNSNHSA